MDKKVIPQKIVKIWYLNYYLINSQFFLTIVQKYEFHFIRQNK